MLNIILFQPEKPSNVGNIMRSCVATNSKLIIIGPLTYKIDDYSLKRAGMDYIKDLNFEYYEDYDKFLKIYHNQKIYYISRYSKNIYSEANFKNIVDDLYFMFGKESSGIPHDILKTNLDKTLRIPMIPSARSLNLSNCVAIILFEALRQRNFYGLSTKEMIKGEDFLINEK